MGVKSISFGFIFLILVAIVFAGNPQMPYTLWGNIYVNNQRLTKEDSSIITLTVDGDQLVSFKMGGVDADSYVLIVPIDNQDDIEGFAQTGDSAQIFVNGKEVDQSPITIGGMGETLNLDLTVGSEQQDEPEEEQQKKSSSSGGSSGSSDREPEKESIVITVSDEEPTNEEVEEQRKAIITKTIEVNKETESVEAKEKVEQTNGEEKISVIQRLANFLGFGEKSTTGAAVAQVPSPKPLIGILIALVIIAAGLAIAYLIVFKKEGY